MKKLKKISLVTFVLAGTLITTSIGVITISSCSSTSSSEQQNQTTGYNPVGYSIESFDLITQDDETLAKLGLVKENQFILTKDKKELVSPSWEFYLETQKVLEIPSTVEAITGYTQLVKNDDGTTTKKIKGAFEESYDLETINLNNTKIIGEKAFYFCARLKSIKNSTNIEYIGDNAFSFFGYWQTYGIEPLNLSNVTHIGENAFYASKAYVFIINNTKLKYIGTSAFKNSTNIGTIDLSKSTLLTNINEATFSGAKINNITLPPSIKTIEKDAFRNAQIGLNLPGADPTNLDLSELTELNKIEPGVFSGSSLLSTLTLPANAIKFETSVGMQENDNSQPSYNYLNSAFANNKDLKIINYAGFEESGTNLVINNVTSSNWESKIQNNNKLWTTITTVMNSLGYDESINKVANSTGMVMNNGVWPTTPSSTNYTWYQNDITKNDLVSNSNQMWFTTLDKVNEASPTPDAQLQFNQSYDTSSNTFTCYIKHNGIVWKWIQTKEANSNNITSITLESDESTPPNVYKATKSGGPVSAVDQAYTFKTWTSTTNLASNNGVKFNFNIANKNS